ncbi:late embryogenesis abundant protein, group [Thalictrum thalictroides]|uniref:Late embryogenesis abundant protein, group n=1 Tax=Thalictrum thalictroides TaxID=46969 RepID=A0A7J6UZX2_THATH|nr:late embryogenesis abundant protein, group [Thalictrum thalictroides]
MHMKSDSEVTSLDASTPPRSPRRPVYYVQSPSQHDVEKMSYGSSPIGSPGHYYHCSPIHHSRESSSTTRFSASIKNPRNLSTWKKIHTEIDEDDDEDQHDEEMSIRNNPKFYVICFVFCFVLLFSFFSLILWGASKPYEPKISVKEIVLKSFNIQSGSDRTGVPSEMLTLESTVKMVVRNPATFFKIHVSASPLQLQYLYFTLASGEMEEFSLTRKKERIVKTSVNATSVPLYGALPVLANTHGPEMNVALNLTFVVRSRAYVLGKLVRHTFHRKILCHVTFKSKNLGHPNNLTNSCEYH